MLEEARVHASKLNSDISQNAAEEPQPAAAKANGAAAPATPQFVVVHVGENPFDLLDRAANWDDIFVYGKGYTKLDRPPTANIGRLQTPRRRIRLLNQNPQRQPTRSGCPLRRLRPTSRRRPESPKPASAHLVPQRRRTHRRGSNAARHSQLPAATHTRRRTRPRPPPSATCPGSSRTRAAETKRSGVLGGPARAGTHPRFRPRPPVGPWALFGILLVRTAANIPANVVLPPLVGGHASLNLFVALVSYSGGGKGSAENAASDAMDLEPVPTYGPGSGEGIAHLFATYNKNTDKSSNTRPR